MRYTTQTENLVINNASGNFCDTITHIPETQEAADYGKVFIACEITSDPECSNEIVSLILDKCISVYYEDLTRDTFESFEQALHAINQTLSQYAHTDSSWVGKVNMSVAILSGNTLHITTSGKGEVYLIRDDQLIDIAEDLSSDEEIVAAKTFFNISSGELVPHDTIVLANNKTHHYINGEKLISTVAQTKLSSAPEALAKIIDAQTGTSLSFLLLQYGKEGVEEMHATQSTRQVDGIHKENSESSTATTTPPPPSKKLSIKNIIAKVQKVNMNKWINGIREQAAKIKAKTSRKSPQDSSDEAQPEATSVQKVKKLSIASIKEKFSKETAEKATSLVILTCVSILILIIAFNFIRKDTSTEAIEMRSIYNEINGRIDDADLKSLYDKPSAQALLDRQVERLTDLQDKGFSDAKIQESLDEVNNIRDKIFNTSRFVNPEAQADIATSNENAKARAVVSVNDRITIVGEKGIYEIADNLINPKEVIAPDANETIITATALQNDNAIVLTTSAGRMVRIKDGNVEEVPSPNEGWPLNASDITEYINTNKLYILDPQENEIWNHSLTGTKASKAKRKNGIGTDLTQARSLAIDGNIYTLNAEGSIIKTYGGEIKEFELRGMPSHLSIPTSIFTTANHDSFYILYPTENAIVYTTKEGRFLGQYVLEAKGDQVVDFYPNEEELTMTIVTSSGKLYKVKK